MTKKVLKNIIEFAEGGLLKAVAVGGIRWTFSTLVPKEKGSKERVAVAGTKEYRINYADDVLQVTDEHGTYFIVIEQISAVEMEL